MRTFLFSDLRDYTVFIETRGDEAATKMLRASRRAVRDAVAEHHGAEIKTEGDSFYVVFRSPSSAVRCAIEIQKAAARHTERHPDLPVRMGVGINTGEAIPHDKGYVGAAVVVAARLSSAAKPGQILVTDTVRSLVRTGGHASMRDLGSWMLKGISEPVHTFEVDPQPAGAGRALGPVLTLPPILVQADGGRRQPMSSPQFIGRERELALLRADVSAAGRGELRIVGVIGDAGMGKTRLCREIALVAQGEGHYVFAGRAEPGRLLPYGPLISALRPYTRARGADVLKRLLGPLSSELRALVPEMEIASPPPIEGIPEEERRERLMRAIQLILEDAASQRPTLLILEDIQDADASSVDLLRFLVDSLRSGVCIIATARAESLSRNTPLRSLLADLDRERRSTRIRLGPLDEAGVSAMLRSLVPDRATADLIRSVHERTGGVPFYIEELVKTADDDASGALELALPGSVRDSVCLRVARLVGDRGPEAGDLLETLAVAATPLDAELLARATDRSEMDVLADLTSAVGSQLIEQVAGRPDSYRYRHALTREAVTAEISPPKLRQLALRLAETIEAGRREEHATLLARLFVAAGDVQRSIPYTLAAADVALGVGAYGSAIHLLDQAASQARGIEGELQILDRSALALRAAGRAAEAETAIGRARALAEAAGAAELVARFDIRLAEILAMQGRRPEARLAAERAARAAPDSSELAAEAFATLARLARAEDDWPRASDLARRALALAEATGSHRVAAYARAVLGSALARGGDLSGLRALRQAIGEALAHGSPTEAVTAYLDLVRAHRSFGEWSAAREAAEEGMAVARDRGLEIPTVRLLEELTLINYTQGRYADARTAAEQAVALARPGTTAATSARSRLALVRTMQGEYAAALALAVEIATEMQRAEPDQRMAFLATRARALLGLGQLDEALVAARAAVEFALEAMPRAGIDAFLAALDVVESRRDGPAARILVDQFESHFAGREAAPVDLVRSEMSLVLAATHGRAGAAAHDAVADRYAALGVPIRAAFRRAMASIERIRHGSTRRAQEQLAEVSTELVRTGATYYITLIERASARVRTRRAVRSPRVAPFAEREMRVALLLAQGATDARISSALRVSRPEAARTVGRVLAKLGVRSRGQVASWVVQREGAAAAS